MPFGLSLRTNRLLRYSFSIRFTVTHLPKFSFIIVGFFVAVNEIPFIFHPAIANVRDAWYNRPIIQTKEAFL